MEGERLRLWRLFILGRTVVTGLFVLALGVMNGLVPPASFRPLMLLTGVQFAANGIYLYLWQRRDLGFLTGLCFSLEIILITLLIYFLGPDGHGFVLAYLWPIIMGGWLSGRRAVPALTLLSALGCMAHFILEQRGLALSGRLLLPDGTPLAWVLSLPYLLFISLLVWLLTAEIKAGEQRLELRNKALHELNTKLRALVAASEDLLGCLDVDQLASAALRSVSQVTGHTRAAIYLRQGDDLCLYRQSESLDVAARPSAVLPVHQDWEDMAGDSAEEVGLWQETASPLPDGGLPVQEIRIPLRSPRTLEGLLAVFPDGAAPLDQSEAGSLQILGHQVGVALENGRLFEDLQYDRNLLREIMGHMAEGIVVIDRDSRVLLANRAANSLMGVYQDRPLPEPFRECLRALQQSPQDGFRGVECHGRMVSISVAELPGIAKIPASTIYVARDITQQIQMEQMKADFVAYASHELRTPLTTIKMLVQLLLMDAPEEGKQRQYLSVIRQQLDRQVRLVNNLLDFTRLEAGKYDLALEEVEPQQVIQVALGACRPLADEKRQHLTIDCAANVGKLIANAGGVEQVLINLLSNAIKFTPEEGHIRLSCRRVGRKVALTVEDTGVGMTPEQLQRIFTKFYTARNPGKRSEGTGLGLVISDMIV
ncbi:MAG: PAS domain-containing protein, partial [Chloroflexi bacterium]|nr:PAS domain-containing protein [Chloroflexota bacterium]